MTIPSLFVLIALPLGIGQDTLDAVDLYGLRTVGEATVRATVGLAPGDPTPPSVEPIRARLLRIPGVADADVSLVCCSERGRWLLYVGIRETGTPPPTFRSAPTGDERLPAEVTALGERFETALMNAVRRGNTGEDDSRGYALSTDSATRSVQEAFIGIAERRFQLLATVLRRSSDASHRALAAEIIAYAPDKSAVTGELREAVLDPSEDVRNNATRALAVLAAWANRNPDGDVSIPAGVFVEFLNSVSWTDRNKGIFVLMPLTERRDPALLAQLRERALPSLIEMARWSDPSHALQPFIVLARVVGITDADAFQAWQSGQREQLIERAQSMRR